MADFVFGQSTVAPQLLGEIAAFPAGVPDPPEGPLPAATRRSLPQVQKITVAMVPAGSLTEGTGAQFDRTFPAAAYPVDVVVKRDDNPNPAKRDTYTFWPPVFGLPKADYIRWGFWRGETQMAVDLFHELIHIWFVYKYYYYTGQTGRSTGHGAYQCPTMGFTFYDPIPATNPQCSQIRTEMPVFQCWLSRFTAEADAHDQAVKPPPDRQIPVNPWDMPCQPSP